MLVPSIGELQWDGFNGMASMEWLQWDAFSLCGTEKVSWLGFFLLAWLAGVDFLVLASTDVIRDLFVIDS